MDSVEVIRQQVHQIFSDALSLQEFASHENYFNLGGNSIHAYFIVAELNDAFALDFNIGDIFEHPSVDKLAEYIAKKRGQ